MSLHDTCAFCLKLPVTAHRSGKITRCPLCRTTLIESGSGVTHRFDESGAPARGSGRGYLWLAGGAASLLAVWLGTQLLQSSPSTRPPAAPSVSPNTPATVAQARPAAETIAPSPVRARKSEATTQAAPRLASAEEKSKAPARVKDTAHSTSYVSGRAKAYAVPHPAEPTRTEVTRWADFSLSPELQRQLLLDVPEIRLKDIPVAASPAETRKQIIALAKEIEEKNKKQTDGYIRALMSERADLAGLPFLLGKDCTLPKDRATKFGTMNLLVRRAMQSSITTAPSSRTQPSSGGMTSPSGAPDASSFWNDWQRRYRSAARDVLRDEGEHVSALVQILGPEHGEFHRGMVEYLRQLNSKAATVALAREALFALEPETRLCAVETLRHRSTADYTPILLDGLQYPWPPVADHAAQALMHLQRKDVVPQLVERLESADPCAPLGTTVDGKKVTAVRELVRINHHRNCLLCHEPANSRGASGIAGLVPTPGVELPAPFTTEYYDSSGSRGSTIFARADVTYLRQDFSVMQPAADHAAFVWPQMQRFDFLVRTRALNKQELADYRAREQANANKLSPHHQAILRALRGLTGKDLGTTGAEWRAALSIADNAAWRSPCAK